MKYQTEFSETFKFESSCAHCGKPMSSISIDRFDREPGPGGAFFRRGVFKIWINPEHECSYLSISAKAKEAA